MRTKILITLFLTGVLLACSKNVYNTKPTIKITSVSSNVVPPNGTLVFNIKVTDKEGDVTDSIFIKKVRTNQRATPTIRDSFAFKIPDAPNASDGEVEISLDYQKYLVSAITPNGNDTLLFKFALKDKAKNTSDTITSGTIVILR